MLVLSRQREETIMIGDEVEVTIVDIRGDKVRLGIRAPRDISVHRKEVYEAIKRENQAAARVRPQDLPGRPGGTQGGVAGKLAPVRPASRPETGTAQADPRADTAVKPEEAPGLRPPVRMTPREEGQRPRGRATGRKGARGESSKADPSASPKAAPRSPQDNAPPVPPASAGETGGSNQ
jgi:carbon storage regulator